MADSIRIHALHSRLNESLTNLFDSLGVKRNFSSPYIDGQPASEAIANVGSAAKSSGGLIKNFVTNFHHSGGRGWGTGDGLVVGYPTHDLRETKIPKDDPQAQAALLAARQYLNGIQKLLPHDKDVQNSQAQLDLFKNGGAGMDALSFGQAMQMLITKPTQAVARAHNGVKPTGHSPKPMPPQPQPIAAQEGNSNV